MVKDSKPSEMAAILREMKQFNANVLEILSEPDVPQPIPMSSPPIVHIAPPNVSVMPSITVEQPARRWRFTVTKRDATAQQRIQEIIVESL